MSGRHVELAVRAQDLSLRSGGRTVFSGVDLAVPTGSMLVVRGGAGSGKTSLLLTLAGRMRPTGGTLRVLGHELPAQARAVRRRAALGEVRGVNDLDDALTVEQHVAERVVLHQPWWRPWASRAQVDEQLDRVEHALGATAQAGAAVPALHRREFVSDVDPLERAVLGVVLALVGRPELLLVDDVDALRRAEDRRRAWHALTALRRTSAEPLTVVATCTDDPDLPRGADADTLLTDLQDA
ncbi:ABC transporter ATP-binding protein [Kineococcus indalonis]|uniref:ABC transporter ATP-binding protein n=1 Tax=Kineococcus indalonis TaxID=2696566 RepID=UPI0014121E81|nr:ATP-binding cassette domain-containing protein [Kineococcus indalonis]NAZ88058.1 ATP-binding cassette domain-containing protein [Kineococcus indalonis]